MNGVLIIDKPAGLTSHDVVARARKIIGERRAGHTGTLDPFATGVLVVLVGRATRLAQFLSGAEKEYEAVIRLGYATDTGDSTGARVEGSHAKTPSPQSLRQEVIETALASLTGEIEQVPPMYSAKKIAGRRLYEHARRGEQVERQAVRVTIHEFALLPRDGEALRLNEEGSADLQVRIVCTAGTYVRTLAEDLGKKLGTGAHLAELRRRRAGRFAIETAITLDMLRELAASGKVDSVMVSPHDALSQLPLVELDGDQARRAVNGIDLPVEQIDTGAWCDGALVRMSAGNQLIAIGRFDAGAQGIHPVVVLATN